MSPSTPQALVGLTGLAANVSGVQVYRDRISRMELPEQFDAQHMTVMENDLAALLDIAREHGDDLLRAQNAMLKNDFVEATRLANDIGLNETSLVSRGGGKAGLVAAVVIAILLVSCDPTETPPPPPPPPPDGGHG